MIRNSDYFEFGIVVFAALDKLMNIPMRHKRTIKKAAFRATAFVALLTFYASLLAPMGMLVQPLRAQPVTVPNITTPAFNSTDFDPYFQQAANSFQQSEWENQVAAGLSTISSAWEASVDAQINTYVASVTHSDAFNSNADYQDYMRDQLELQKKKRRRTGSCRRRT